MTNMEAFSITETKPCQWLQNYQVQCLGYGAYYKITSS
jgi:hypothetical protein